MPDKATLLKNARRMIDSGRVREGVRLFWFAQEVHKVRMGDACRPGLGGAEAPEPDKPSRRYARHPYRKEWKMSAERRIEGYKRTLYAFEVMHRGWEYDEDAWVVELTDGSIALVATTHGSPYIAQASEFEEKLAEYERAIAGTRHALSLIAQTPAQE